MLKSVQFVLQSISDNIMPEAEVWNSFLYIRSI